VVRIVERKGDMRGVPVRVRVVISPGDASGRIGRETRGTIARKKGKRGRIRLIMTVVVTGLVVDSCRVLLLSTASQARVGDCGEYYCTVQLL